MIFVNLFQLYTLYAVVKTHTGRDSGVILSYKLQFRPRFVLVKDSGLQARIRNTAKKMYTL